MAVETLEEVEADIEVRSLIEQVTDLLEGRTHMDRKSVSEIAKQMFEEWTDSAFYDGEGNLIEAYVHRILEKRAHKISGDNNPDMPGCWYRAVEELAEEIITSYYKGRTAA